MHAFVFHVWYIFNAVTHFFNRIQVFMILIIYCFYTMSGIFILLHIFFLKHYIDFL